MLKDDLATRARAFIDRTELPPKPPATRGPRTTPTDPGTTPAMAIGQNLVEFADDAPPELRAAVTDALLLAQLAADKAESATPDQWYEQHRSVLTHLGFLGDGLTRTAQDFSSEDGDLHEAILPVITAAFAGVGVPALVIETLRQLSSIDEGKSWITLFERESKRFGARQFQISKVAGTPEQQQVNMLGFVMDVGQTATQALFFRHAKDTVAVERVEGHFTVEAATLLEIAPALADKLRERRASYLEALDI